MVFQNENNQLNIAKLRNNDLINMHYNTIMHTSNRYLQVNQDDGRLNDTVNIHINTPSLDYYTETCRGVSTLVPFCHLPSRMEHIRRALLNKSCRN